ncbi:integral membrane protein [Xylaria sp. FL0933]|nr:integral membrane protein [Xylaria sp. FL0933]
MSIDNLGVAVVSIAWVFAALAAVVIAARIYIRFLVVRRATIDDYIIILAFCLAIINSVFVTVSASWGLGQHISSLQPESIRYTVKYVYLCEFFSILSPGFGRISYGFLLVSLVPPSQPQRRFLWGVIALQFFVDVGTVIISFIQCRPIEGFWDTRVKADCWSPHVQQSVGFAQGSICSVVDLILAIFPASLFWNLNMKLGRRISLSALMGLGIFALIASVIKTIKLQAITQTDDLTYAMADLAIWWTLEAYLVLIAVSIPTLKPIISTSKRHDKKSTNTFNATNTSNSRRKAQLGSAQCENRPFERLYDSSTLANITSNNRLATYRSSEIELTNNHSEREIELQITDGIRKDVTVSVSYDSSSPDCYELTEQRIK